MPQYLRNFVLQKYQDDYEAADDKLKDKVTQLIDNITLRRIEQQMELNLRGAWLEATP